MPAWKKTFIALFVSVMMAAAADPALVNLVMREARIVSGVDIERVKSSPLGQLVITWMQPPGPDLQKFIGETGFNPLRDAREVLMASPAVPGNNQALVLVRGVFDPPKIIELARSQGAVVEQYKGVSLLRGMEKAKDGKEPPDAWLAFLDGSIAALGDQASVRGAIDRRGAPARLDPKIARRVHELSNLYDAWGVSAVSPTDFSAKVTDERLKGLMQGDVLSAIEESSGGVRLGADIELSGEAVTRSDKDAQALADVIRFFASMLQMNRKDAKVAAPQRLLESLNITTKANVTQFSVKIAQADIERFFNQARQTRKNAGSQ